MFSIEGWEELFITYQYHCTHILDTIHRRVNIDNIHVEPDISNVFNAFRLCPYNSVRLVILGQDPYSSMARGVAFSYHKMTPSLDIIRTWLDLDHIDTYLDSWVKQGILLINTAMTIEVCDNPISHKILWEQFIRGCLDICSRRDIVYLLLGKVACSYSSSISSGLVLKENHPSYYHRCGKYESKRWLFNEINTYLISKGHGEIHFNSISL